MGASHQNGVHRNGATLSPLAIGLAAITAMEAGLADAEAREDEAEAALDLAAAAFEVAQVEEVRALQLSRAGRSDTELADSASRAGVAAQHARLDRDDAEKVAASARENLTRAIANLENAKRAHELAEILASLDSGEYERETKANVASIVDAAQLIAKAVRSIRTRLEVDSAAVNRVHALNGSADVRPRDGTSAAGLLAASLLEAGATAADPNVHSLRWLFDPLTPALSVADPADARGAGEVFRVVLASFAQAARDDAAGAPSRGKETLARVARVWPHCRTKSVSDALDRAEANREGEVIQERRKREHEARLEFARRTAAATAGVPLHNGKPMPGVGAGQAKAAPLAKPYVHPASRGSDQPDGEFLLEGSNDFDVPPVG